MPIRRIVVEINLDTLSFDDLHRVTGAVNSLEKLAAAGAIAMRIENVKGSGVLRKPRSDKRSILDKELQPQTIAVLNYLFSTPEGATPQEIARALGIGENSIRPQLTLLLKRGLALQFHEPRTTPGRRAQRWKSAKGSTTTVPDKAPSAGNVPLPPPDQDSRDPTIVHTGHENRLPES